MECRSSVFNAAQNDGTKLSPCQVLKNLGSKSAPRRWTSDTNCHLSHVPWATADERTAGGSGPGKVQGLTPLKTNISPEN